jgi:hypothetical protein
VNCICSVLSLLHIDFHSGRTNLHSHLQCMRVLSWPPTSSPAFVVCFLDACHSDWVILFAFPLWLRVLNISFCVY